MQYQILTLAALIAGASARTTLTQMDTVTEQHTTDVTVTHCSDDVCATTTINSISQTTVTTTVDGIETVYTTVCPESTAEESATGSASVTSSEISLAGVVSTAPGHGPASVSGSDIFVDVTVTPTVTSSTNVEATATQQSTMTSIFNSGVPTLAAIAENNANKKAIGMVGLVGVVAALL